MELIKLMLFTNKDLDFKNENHFRTLVKDCAHTRYKKDLMTNLSLRGG